MIEPAKGDWIPNAGPQTRFLSLTCFEALYGGSAGGGKSESLLIDAIRHVGRGHGTAYKALLLRREFPELEKSLILRSHEIYPRLGGLYGEMKKCWRFPGGERVYFGHLQYEHDVQQYQSAEFQFVGFDEATQFTAYQYTYLISRLRSACGIPLRLRGATNPGGPGHEWAFKRFAPWLDPECTVTAKPGEVLHFTRDDDGAEHVVPKGTPGSLGRTFVPARLGDNPYLDGTEYSRGLMELDPLTRAQLKDGDWLAKPSAGMYFQRAWFDIVQASPATAQRVRYWDRASTGETEAVKRRRKDPDYTVGLKLAKDGGTYFVEDVVRFRGTPHEVEMVIRQTATMDGKAVMVALEQDPGQAGQFEIDTYIRNLDGFNVRAFPARQDKIVRAQPASAQAEARNIKLVSGEWNEAFLREVSSFPEGDHDDQVDTLSGAHTALSRPVAPPRNVRQPTRDSYLDDDCGL